MFDIALFEPQIAPNTGNIIRLVANNGCRLHLIEPLGFSLDEKKVRRAGLDYHDMANVTLYQDYWSFQQAMKDHRIL
ncbi:MAG: TrmH family RNA methyltransferase, partial [Reinekea sp.]